MYNSLDSHTLSFSYPEPILRAVNGARQGALAKSISNWHLIGHNEGCCSNTGYILLPCFYGIRLWIWPEPLVAPRVRRALGTRMILYKFLLCDVLHVYKSDRSQSFYLFYAFPRWRHRIGRYSRSVTQASICPRFYKRFVINHAILASTTGTLYLPNPDKNFRLY